MKELGQKLKETREKRNLSVQDVSVAIKINSKTLQAMEEGDLTQLPAKPFLRGFVQTYSKFLELNVDDIMKLFTEELGTTRPKIAADENASTETIQSTDEAHKKIDLFKKAGFVVAALVAVLLVYVAQRVVGRYEKEQQVAQTQKEALENQVAQEAPVASATDTANTSTENKDSVLQPEIKALDIKPEEALKVEGPTPLVPQPAEKVVVQPTPPAPTPAVVAQPKPVTPPPAPAVLAPKPAPTPALPKPPEVKKVEVTTPPVPAATNIKKAPQQIIIEALDNVEVRYIKDGDSEKTVRLKPEQVLTIRADFKVNLNINDGGAVSIIRNGKDSGVPGNLGKSVKLNYP